MKNLEARKNEALSRATEFVSTREAAELLGVSLRTVQLWVESGDLAAWKTVGGHRRITLPSVVQLLDEQLAALEKPKADSVYRILIIDPDPPSADHFAKSLAEADPRVMLDCAQDGYHGLMLAGRNIPRLLIVEPSRSGLDSLRLATALRLLPEPTPRVVVLAERDSLASQDGGCNHDGFLAISKNSAVEEITAMVKADLDSARPRAMAAQIKVFIDGQQTTESASHLESVLSDVQTIQQ